MNKVIIYRSFDDLPASHEALFRDASSASGIFLSLPWFRNLAATALEAGGKLRIYCVESAEGKPCLALPMWQQAAAPRKLTAASNYYTSLFSPLFSPPAAAPHDSLQENMRLLVAALAADRPAWGMIDLHPMAPDTPLFDAALAAFRAAGMPAESYFCFGNWYLELNGRSYRDYFDGLPSRLKNTVKRKSRQLEDAGRLRVDIITGDAGLERGIAAYESIYRSSWKKPEPHPDFIPGLIRSCARQGWLRLGIVWIDGQAAAAQLWIVHHGVASIYKLAYDERFAKLSAGSILTARLMQHVIDIDRVREVDYLTGDDAYKRDWMSHRRERRGIIAFNPRTLHGMFAALRHFAGRAAHTVHSVRSVRRKPSMES